MLLEGIQSDTSHPPGERPKHEAVVGGAASAGEVER